MDAPVKEVYILVLLLALALARTLRYQVVTKDDGTKEILNHESGASPSQDLQFLAKDLNFALEKVHERSSDDLTTPVEEHFTEDPHYLLNKLNSYTSNGWTGQNNAVYLNSTKLVIFDDSKTSPNAEEVLSNHQVKQGRAENLTSVTELIEVPIDQPGLWEVIERLYDCFNDFSKHGSTMSCLKSRATTLILKFIDQSLATPSGKSNGQKTLVHGKKVLKGALLPLLVLLIIKYLIALPVIAAGLITIKTFWLSLLSAGVAAFGAPWKNPHVIKRYRPDAEQAWSQPPAWASTLHPAHEAMGKLGTGAEKFFM